ncbi:uncharacterized protein LOC129566739 isoform X2 [Sitodiplosis mosellana]|uniref:uncharacterized protein LOC129566739 isoform X2 n=1 Tax=Sitodiplosis mosellana TaxID=263140 RepID=UPI002444BA56|nr:uncharacterized protein LOC129566739 isoform X2 [Sitodiplosis mosellana]
MRRKKGRSTYSFQAMIPIEATTILWASIVSLYFIAYGSCDDAAFNTKLSTISGHVESATPAMQPVIFTNHSISSSSDSIETNHQIHSDQSSSRGKRTFRQSGNELWDGIVNDCLYKPSFSCFQKNIYTYLDNTLKLGDVNVTERIQFKKIDIDPNLLEQLQNNTDEHDNEISQEETREFKSESPIEEVTDALYGKWRNFMMTHNLELKMPEILFDGATFRITPRAFDGDGALVKFEMIPKQLQEVESESGRLFGLKKHIKKFFKNKLLLSFLAIVLVIKLIKIKIFWILPLIVGVTAAKKLLLKFVLFLFPALSHLFKLCSYYHKNYHDTKYHHHHHQINHLHTVVPPWYKDFHDHHPHRPEIIHTAPPRGHPVEYIHSIPAPHPPLHQHYPTDWEHSGPGLGSEYISDIHRNIQVNPHSKSETFKPKLEDDETINSWGLEQAVKPVESTLDTYPANPQASLSPFPPLVSTVESSIGRAPLQEDSYGANSAKVYSTYEPSSQVKYSPDKYLIAEKIQSALRQQPAYAQSMIAADPFYGPIVARIDSILNQYSAYVSEHCKEWLVCNMYKSPAQFSPHSNFLSAELSRDSTELQKPAELNAAVLTFYKYVKAARDGQDQKSCLSLNPKCAM